MIYLATSYTHPEAYVREQRFLQACQIAGDLMARNVIVFSPIVHGHSLAAVVELPTDWTFWKTYCLAMLSKSSGLIVAQMDGWKESVGVQAEIEFATEMGLPIEYLAVEK